MLGAEQGGRAFSCGISFHPIGNEMPDFSMAKYSGIDGAVIYPNIAEEKVRRELAEFSEAGIPIVLIEHTLADELPWPFVGTNNFDLGKKIGRLAAASSSGQLNIALVYSEKSPAIFAEKELVEMGMTSTLGNRLESPLHIMKTDMNPLDAENLTYEILRGRPEINTIVYTDTNDTLAAAQVLVDMNLVGAVQIIGFGSDTPILDYVEQGIFYGTIVVNPYQIGFKAVEVLTGLIEEGHSPAYVDTGVSIVTKDNLEAVRQERRALLQDGSGRGQSRDSSPSDKNGSSGIGGSGDSGSGDSGSGGDSP
jgi:ribose transport system substrate-binding protein